MIFDINQGTELSNTQLMILACHNMADFEEFVCEIGEGICIKRGK